VPWAFDEEAVDVSRVFTRLKLSLMPYIGRLGQDAHEQGLPVMRPMVLEFPDDPGAAAVATQYMLGESLLVAPVFTPDGEVDVYVPDGVWTSLLTGAQVTGPRWVKETHDVLSLPVYVRPDTVLPVGSRSDRPDYDWADGVTLRLFELSDGHRSETVVPAADGGEPTTFVVTRQGDDVRVTVRNAAGPWRVQVEQTDLQVKVADGREVVEIAL